MPNDDYYITPSGQRRLRRLPAGELDKRIRMVCIDWINGDLVVDGPLTVARIQAEVEARFDRQVSPNGVIETLKRWSRIGAAVIDEGPIAFVEFTEAAAVKGFRVLTEEYREYQKTLSGTTPPPPAEMDWTEAEVHAE